MQARAKASTTSQREQRLVFAAIALFTTCAVLAAVLLAMLSSRPDLYAVKRKPVRPGIAVVDWELGKPAFRGGEPGGSPPRLVRAGGADCRIHDSGWPGRSAGDIGALLTGSGSGGLAQSAASPCRRGDRCPAERWRNHPAGGKTRGYGVRKAFFRIDEAESARGIVPGGRDC
jgi:hypothetical protein